MLSDDLLHTVNQPFDIGLKNLCGLSVSIHSAHFLNQATHLFKPWGLLIQINHLIHMGVAHTSGNDATI